MTIKHRRSKTPIYRVWRAMKARCLNPRNSHYRYYGGRGIQICKRWQDSFENFLADMGERPTGLTLERKDNNGNYEPSNCKWATRSEQSLNRRGARLVEYQGQIKNIIEWERKTGISRSTLSSRLDSGRFSKDEIFNTKKLPQGAARGSTWKGGKHQVPRSSIHKIRISEALRRAWAKRKAMMEADV